jgi:2-polyprenyl-3-methyl-5-hydroxy-6-metoxy-1,4-benzoquinol methylase
MPEQHAAETDVQRTFRDPAGSVEIRPGGAFRQVNSAYAPDLLAFLHSPLAQDLVSAGRLIPTEVLALPDIPSDPLRLRHPRVSFPSYPCEWSPALWLSAADLTLDLCRDLLQQGWILKDATPLNVLFRGTQPVFVDLPSIQPADLRQPIWFAYGQFVRTFLLPMLAHTRLGWPLHSALSRRDGLEPEELYPALSWAQRLRQPALSAVTLPRLLTRPARAVTVASRTTQDPELTRHILLKTVASLRTQMHRATPPQRTSNWSEYVDTAAHYGPEDHAAKRSFVREVLAVAQPTHVLDVGCNTGVYSNLAADSGAEVVAIDTDLQAVDRLCTSLQGTTRNSRGAPRNILPLCVDLAHPTPATGWRNRENASFLSRCEGHFDTVMMLAVLHHLLLRGQVPLDHIAALASTLTTRHLILEWVPPQDPMFQQLLRGRAPLYTHLTETAFRAAFAPHFAIVREATLPNQRVLFHFAKRGEVRESHALEPEPLEVQARG